MAAPTLQKCFSIFVKIQPRLSIFSARQAFSSGLQYAGKRSFLSDAYRCQEDWDRRLSSPLIQNIKMDDYYYELDKKLHLEKKASAVDIDLFANKVTEPNQLDDLDDLIHRFRCSPNTVYTLPSTPHAIIRAFLQFGESEELMRILNDRLNYGIFPDYYCSNIMMDTFLKEENYRDAAKVAVQMMLQEDFGNSISQTLALYSCHMYLKKPQPQPWEEEEQEEDKGEEIRVRVTYIRNPFFDDHFDLRDPHHLIGKTLAYLCRGRKDLLGKTYEAIGLALYNKWNEVKSLLEEKPVLAKEGVEKIQEILEKQSDQDECRRLLETVEASKCDLHQIIVDEVKKAVSENEQKDIEQQISLYQQWEKVRWEEIGKQVTAFQRQERLKKLEEKKKELAEKEEVLFFFEKKDKLEVQLEKDTQTLKELKEKLPKSFVLKAQEEEEYIPPDVR